MKKLYEFLPKQLRIAGKHVKVEIVPKTVVEDEGIWGASHADEQLIRICPDASPEHVLDTLLHEVLHAVYAYWNIQDGDDEERTVHTIASALQNLYTDNAHLLKCIQKYADAIRKTQ